MIEIIKFICRYWKRWTRRDAIPERNGYIPDYERLPYPSRINRDNR